MGDPRGTARSGQVQLAAELPSKGPCYLNTLLGHVKTPATLLQRTGLLRSISKDSLERRYGPRDGALVGCDAQAWPCRQTKAMDGLLPVPGVPWDPRQCSRAQAGAAGNAAVSSGWRTGDSTAQGETGGIKSSPPGAFFTLPYAETVSKDRMGETVSL